MSTMILQMIHQNRVTAEEFMDFCQIHPKCRYTTKCTLAHVASDFFSLKLDGTGRVDNQIFLLTLQDKKNSFHTVTVYLRLILL